MSEQIIRRTRRIVDAAMPWRVAAGVYVLLPALGPQLPDPDTYSHITLAHLLLRCTSA
jgi:hypothetical protein